MFQVLDDAGASIVCDTEMVAMSPSFKVNITKVRLAHFYFNEAPPVFILVSSAPPPGSSWSRPKAAFHS